MGTRYVLRVITSVWVIIELKLLFIVNLGYVKGLGYLCTTPLNHYLSCGGKRKGDRGSDGNA